MLNSTTYQTPVTGSIFKAAKTTLILFTLVWGMNYFLHSLSHGYKIAVQGQHESMQFPDPSMLKIITPSGVSPVIKSHWSFQIANRGAKEASEAQLELPFDGFFVLTQGGKKSEVKAFDKKILIGNLNAFEEVNLSVWTSQEIDSRSQLDTRFTHKDGIADIEYPVTVSGFLAWVEQSKSLIAVIFVIFALLFWM